MGYGISGENTHPCTLYVMDRDTYTLIKSIEVETTGPYVFYVGESAQTVDVIGRTSDTSQALETYKDIVMLAGIDPDGIAMIMGGNNSVGTMGTVRKFYSAWTTGTSMTVGKQGGGAANMLDKVHYCVGHDGSNYRNTHDNYSSDTWTSLTVFPDSCGGSIGHTIANEFYAGGGNRSGFNESNWVMTYSKYTAGEVWVNYSMPSHYSGSYPQTANLSSVGDGSEAYLCGGNGPVNELPYNDRDDGNGTYTAMTNWPRSTDNMPLVLIDGDILNFGGAYRAYHNGSQWVHYQGNETTIYSISGNSYTTGHAAQPATQMSAGESAFVIEGKGHVAGGLSGINNTVENNSHNVYTPTADTWATDTVVPEAIKYHRTVLA